jgi:hypothetical protein
MAPVSVPPGQTLGQHLHEVVAPGQQGADLAPLILSDVDAVDPLTSTQFAARRDVAADVHPIRPRSNPPFPWS